MDGEVIRKSTMLQVNVTRQAPSDLPILKSQASSSTDIRRLILIAPSAAACIASRSSRLIHGDAVASSTDKGRYIRLIHGYSTTALVLPPCPPSRQLKSLLSRLGCFSHLGCLDDDSENTRITTDPRLGPDGRGPRTALPELPIPQPPPPGTPPRR